MDKSTLIELSYLAASVCFILGIKRLSKPATAPAGNRLAAFGMLIAVVATLIHIDVLSPAFIIFGIVVGSLIGAWMAIKVEMTGMPEMVALFNGFGGAFSVLVAWAYYARFIVDKADFFKIGGAGGGAAVGDLITVMLSVTVGCITLMGSVLVMLRLSG
ncbi:MAG TPA: NAD synthetase, partial [Myxococcales bacterium]|nr:NAD synthetase [Myxococcales bacterium]